MNPVLIGGTRLLGPALVAAAKSIPASQLAKFGLLRGPLVGFTPAIGAFLGGAATVALLVPGSREWIKARAVRAFHFLKEWSAEVPGGEESEESEESNGTSRQRRPQRRVRGAAEQAAPAD